MSCLWVWANNYNQHCLVGTTSAGNLAKREEQDEKFILLLVVILCGCSPLKKDGPLITVVGKGVNESGIQEANIFVNENGVEVLKQEQMDK